MRLCGSLVVGKKSQIQALDRTQASLPMKRGRADRVSHAYKRNGTTTLFAALSTLDGSVVGQCLPRYRHQESLKFLRTLDREFPAELQLHLILDNTRPTSTRTSLPGFRSTRASVCTSRRPPAPG